MERPSSCERAQAGGGVNNPSCQCDAPTMAHYACGWVRSGCWFAIVSCSLHGLPSLCRPELARALLRPRLELCARKGKYRRRFRWAVQNRRQVPRAFSPPSDRPYVLSTPGNCRIPAMPRRLKLPLSDRFGSKGLFGAFCRLPKQWLPSDRGASMTG